MRECNICPPQITKCAHWDGRVLFMAESKPPLCGLHWGIVVRIAEGLPDAVWGCCKVAIWSKPMNLIYDGFDYDAALAAFRDAEIELLRGVAVG